ncbi:HIRAN protein [Dechloromonas denitrificans]|uniref:HIRAN protein n=1 Tax=Dechloromonas denitrificans TaxID=281362 RepID=A0A133XKX4_9RHOO|nr:HIRAN domain-containing protein [Dechloromonas denitrificans]KXB31589.1 HIRAN protein [Dechloromonas denitrificans]
MRLLLTISLALWLGLWLIVAQAESVRLLVQSSPLAGSQYYAVGEFWQQLQVGDALTLVREPDNRHDRHAIRVEWRGHQLGYVPRAENRSVAAAMDQGERLVARIARLTEHPNPWRRVEFEVFIEL